jgi:hypothetical protein
MIAAECVPLRLSDGVQLQDIISAGRRSILPRLSDAASNVLYRPGQEPGRDDAPYPCGADASLTGYGGGVDRKRWLLAHEGAAFEDLAVGRVSNAA